MSRWPTGRASRWATGLLAAALGLTVCAAPAPAAAAPVPAAGARAHALGTVDTPDVAPATVTITSISPPVVRATDRLVVTGLVRNTSDSPISYATARLRLQRERLGERPQVSAWLSGADLRTGVVVGARDLRNEDGGAVLAPGGSLPFTFTLDQAALGLGGASFGAYGIAIEARGQMGGPREQVGELRSALIWAPAGRQYVPQQLSWLVPFTGLPGAAGPRAPTTAQVAAAVRPGSRLRRVLAAGSVPGVAWAVDPALLTTLTRAAGAPAPTSGSTSDTPPSGSPTPPSPSTATTTGADPDAAARAVVASYLTDLRAAAAGRVVVELPYGDPDVEAVSAAGQPDLLRSARAAGAGIVQEVLGVTPETDVAWPADGWASGAAVDAAAAAGAHAVVLDARARPLVDALSYTSDARATLAGGVSGWLVDPALAGLVAEARSSDLLRVQAVLAQTAAATTERPGLTRRLLVAAPRTFDPDPAAFRALVDAAGAAPWLTTVPLTALRDPLPRGDTSDLARRTAAAPKAVSAARISARDVRAVRDQRAELAALGEVVAQPGALTSALQRSTLELLSTAWRGHARELRTRRTAVGAQITALTGKLHVLPTDVTLLARDSSLRFTVANDLDQRASDLRLRVTAPNPRLEIRHELTDPVDLAPGTRARVAVPVRALASGIVTLSAQLVTPSGAPIGAPVSVRVRTQPTDTWALWVLGALAGLVVLVGLVRALRRPRRRALVAADTGARGDDTDPGEEAP